MTATYEQANQLINALEATHNTTEYLQEWPGIADDLRLVLETERDATISLFTTIAAQIGGILIQSTNVKGQPSKMLVVGAALHENGFVYSCLEQGANNAPDRLSGSPLQLRLRYLAAQTDANIELQ